MEFTTRGSALNRRSDHGVADSSRVERGVALLDVVESCGFSEKDVVRLISAVRVIQSDSLLVSRDALMQAMLKAQIPAVEPASLVQVQKWNQRKLELLGTPHLSYEELGKLRHDSNVGGTRNTVTRWRKSNRAFTVTRQGKTPEVAKIWLGQQASYPHLFLGLTGLGRYVFI